MKHITVLKDEGVQQLNLQAGSVVVDCTLGSGGHSRAILDKIGAKGTLIALDVDEAAIKVGESLKAEYKSTIHLVNKNFRTLSAVLEALNLESVDAILADLGWRTEQFASSEGEPRGFSFAADEPLKMTFGNSGQYSFTAADIVNDWAEEDIANVIYGYGEDRAARRIARAIIEARQLDPITTAKGLAAIVESAVHVRGYSKIHPATKTFQALRIAVNDEFDALSELLFASVDSLKPNGRLVVISFHSLEDRIVKHTFRDFVHDHKCVLVHKKPITPLPEELLSNPRSRSAKLRTIQKLP